MTILTLPADLRIETATLRPVTNQRVHSSGLNLTDWAVDLLVDRWEASITLGVRYADDAAAIEAFLNNFRGQVNTVGLWPFYRPVPRGTMRGSPVLASAVAQFAASLPLTVAAGATLKAGDFLGVNSQLVQVASDCAAVGTLLTVPIINRLRSAASSGSVVTWQKPTAQFRLLTNPGMVYRQGIVDGLTLDFGEAI